MGPGNPKYMHWDFLASTEVTWLQDTGKTRKCKNIISKSYFYLLAFTLEPCVCGIGCANPINNNGNRGLNSPHAMLKMCPLKNTACVIDLGYLFELAKWISWIFVASFESTPIFNQTHTLLKDLIWHLTILYINIPLFFLNRCNPPKS